MPLFEVEGGAGAGWTSSPEFLVSDVKWACERVREPCSHATARPARFGFSAGKRPISESPSKRRVAEAFVQKDKVARAPEKSAEPK